MVELSICTPYIGTQYSLLRSSAYRQALLAAQRHGSDEKRPESTRGMDSDDKDLVDVVGSPDSPLNPLHPAGSLSGHHPSEYTFNFCAVLPDLGIFTPTWQYLKLCEGMVPANMGFLCRIFDYLTSFKD